MQIVLFLFCIYLDCHLLVLSCKMTLIKFISHVVLAKYHNLLKADFVEIMFWFF